MLDNSKLQLSMKAIRLFFAFLCAVIFSFDSRAQTTLAAGDIAIVGYNGDANNDDFSFILLTNVSSGTTVNFTDFGWCSGAGFTGFQSANPGPCGAGSFGSYSDGALTWTTTSALPCGTQVYIRTRNGMSASTGTVTGLQATFNVPSDYMSLAIGGDQIFAFQGSLSSPTFITGISTNGAWDATLAQCAFTSSQSTLPASLSSSTSLELIPEVDNAIYNCAVTANSPANLRAAIFNSSNWTGDDIDTFALPLACTFSCNSNLAPTFTAGSPQSLTVCQNAAATSINSFLQVSDGNSGQTLTWTISSAPLHGTLGGFNYSTTSTGGSLTPTGLTYTPTNGYSGADAFTIQISDGIATATTTINITVNALPTAFTVIGGGSYCAGGSGVAVGLSNSQTGVNYQLKVGGVNTGSPVAGTTGLGINFGAKTTAGNYTVEATNASTSCSRLMSGSVNITVTPLPTITLGASPSVPGGTTSAGLPYTATTGSPTNYTISYDATALGAGFANVGSTSLPATPITLTVPAGASLGTYNGNIRVSNGSCQSALTPFTVTLTNAAPTFTGGSPQSLTVCQNSSAVSINSLLQVSDANSGQTLTWSVSSAASHGTVAVSYSTSSNGGTITPVGLTYTPTNGYNGTDAFTVQVSDGIATAATIINVTINPLPTVNAVSNQTVCAGALTAAIAFSGALPSTTFNWTNTNTGIGLSGSGSGDIASFSTTNSGNAPITATITVTPVKSGCIGSPTNFTITVNPTPTVNAISNQAVCHNSPTAAVAFSGALSSTTFNWTNDQTSIGLAANGSGDIASFTATNSGTAPVVATVTVTPIKSGCPGTPRNFSITVNPVPTVNAVSNQTVCNNSSTASVVFSGAVSGTSFNWTNNQTSIGLAASGSGDMAAFTATNSGTTPITATVTVTPVRAGCTGTSTNFTFTVDPSPTVNVVTNQAVCHNGSTTLIAFAGALSGTTYNWTNDQASIGLASSGSGDIASFSASNTGTAPVVATITVTPVKNGCSGVPVNFTITVNPIPTVNTVSNQTVCNNASTATVTFGGAVSGTTFNWTNNNIGIGLGANGSGDISSFTAINSGTTAVTGTVMVTPVRAGCTGTSTNFIFTINPSPTVNAVSNQTVCNNGLTVAVAFGGALSSTTFNWANDQPSIGLSANGSGDISSFTATNSGTAPAVATITVTPVKNGCGGAPTNFTITVDPTPTVNTVSNQTLCNGASTTAVAFGGAVTGTTFNWTNSNTSIGLGGSGSGDITSFTAINTGVAPVTATITVTPVNAGCIGTPVNFTITVNPSATVNTVANQAACNGAPTAAIAFSGAASGSTFNWANNQTSIGLAASGSGDIASFTATNSGITPVVATITVTPVKSGCTGTPASFTITVNPTPMVNTVSNQTACNGSTTTAIAFGSVVNGTSFNWTNNQTSVGLAASGTGDIASFIATNAGTTPVTATITVTPVRAGCTGTPRNFTITVNPTPTVNTVSNQSICNNGTTTAVAFNGALTSTTFNWTNDQTSIGLAASGIGDIASFTATNSGTTPVVATITVTPIKSGCLGTPGNFSITVNPIPTVNTVSSQTLCNGAPTAAVAFSGAVSGTTYNWTNNNTFIGLVASGSGNISSFAASNSTTAPVTATITVTPVRVGCAGTSTGFTITVLPTPTVNAVSSQAVCNGAPTATVPFSGALSSTSFSWTNDQTSIGLAASGAGDIASFTAINAGTAPVVATITVTPSKSGCAGPSTSFTITANPIPTVNAVSNQTVCNGTSTAVVSFGGTVSGTTFNWTNSNTSIGLVASGTGNISSFTATNGGTTSAVSTITATPVRAGCTGTPTSFTVTVNPTPTVNTVSNQTVCNGAPTTAINFGGAVTGTTFSWTNNTTSIGLGASGTGNIGSFSTANVTSSPVTATITVTPAANGCTGTVKNFTISVNPTPSVNTVASQTVCNAASVAAIAFGGSAVTGTTYNWTNTLTSIGLTSNGTGNIASFTATNTGSVPVTASITVTPLANGCAGAQKAFAITVNPTATVNAVSNQDICNGANTNAISFGGPVSGTTFSWTNTTASIGLAASGNGNISSFTATNATNAPVTGTITVTPLANGCTGVIRAFTITVNPTPTVNAVSNQTLCNGASTPIITFSGFVPGTSYNWINNTPSIGLASSGAGDIASFVATNTSNTPVTATVSITPVANSCAGTTGSFTITVNPTPTVTAIANQALCGGSTTAAVNFGGPVSGTTYNWTNNNTSIGLAAGGTGNIPSFTATNSGSVPQVAFITVGPSANGCTGTAGAFTITVNPIPILTSTQTAPAICNNTQFGYTPTTATPGTSFAWSRAVVAGISNAAGSGFGSVGEQLVNTTPNPIVVTYVFVLTANSCTNVQNVTVTVNPTPKLNSQLSQVICSDVPFVYTPTSQTTGATYTWSRANVSGITPLTSNGTGSINETLTNNTMLAATVTYVYLLTANGCTNTENVTLTINPRPHATTIAIKSSDEVCAKTMYQNFGAAVAAPQGATYHWTAVNAEVWAQSATGQQALVNFPYPGVSEIVLTTTIDGTGCDTTATYTVEVDQRVAQQPNIIYHNGRFVCLQHDMDSYRWGYDDKGSLDSTIIANETNQDYLNLNPDFNSKYYWVITRQGDCLQKSYYNKPTTIATAEAKVYELKLFPNPASEIINIEFDAANTGVTEVSIYEMAGKLLRTIPAGNGKLQVDISTFAQGFYSVGCVRDGIRIATAKFIKE